MQNTNGHNHPESANMSQIFDALQRSEADRSGTIWSCQLRKNCWRLSERNARAIRACRASSQKAGHAAA